VIADTLGGRTEIVQRIRDARAIAFRAT